MDERMMHTEVLESATDKELIEELASRHEDLLVVRPKATNRKDDAELVVYCKTKGGHYDIFDALDLIHDATIGLMRDCMTKCEDG